MTEPEPKHSPAEEKIITFFTALVKSWDEAYRLRLLAARLLPCPLCGALPSELCHVKKDPRRWTYIHSQRLEAAVYWAEHLDDLANATLGDVGLAH